MKTHYSAEIVDKAISILMLEMQTKSDDSSPRNYHDLSDQAKYLLEFVNFYRRLLNLVEDLSLVIEFIKMTPELNGCNESKITPVRCINYHLEVFYHKIHTILEVFKLATNSIFEFGLSEKQCSLGNLKNKKNEESICVFDVIDRYHRSFEKMINVRHLNTHRAISVNPASDDIDVLIIIRQNNLVDSLPPFFSNMVNCQIESHKQEKISTLVNCVQIAKLYVEEFLNKISIIVERKIS